MVQGLIKKILTIGLALTWGVLLSHCQNLSMPTGGDGSVGGGQGAVGEGSLVPGEENSGDGETPGEGGFSPSVPGGQPSEDNVHGLIWIRVQGRILLPGNEDKDEDYCEGDLGWIIPEVNAYTKTLDSDEYVLDPHDIQVDECGHFEHFYRIWKDDGECAVWAKYKVRYEAGKLYTAESEILKCPVSPVKIKLVLHSIYDLPQMPSQESTSE